MELSVGTYFSNIKIRTVVVDFLALSVIYLLPTMSHLTGIPFYYLEPMRIVVLLSLLFTNRWNSLLLAVFLSIAISKIVYYLLKYAFIQSNLVDGALVTTSLYIQIMLTVVLSFVVAFWGTGLKNKTN